MSPAKVTPPGKAVFFVPEGQYMSRLPGFDSLDEQMRREMRNWGVGVVGTEKGFKMSGYMDRGTWSINVSGEKVAFRPPYIEPQVTVGNPGFRVEKNPLAVILKDHTRIEPVTNREMMHALYPHRRGRSPEK